MLQHTRVCLKEVLIDVCCMLQHTRVCLKEVLIDVCCMLQHTRGLSEEVFNGCVCKLYVATYTWKDLERKKRTIYVYVLKEVLVGGCAVCCNIHMESSIKKGTLKKERRDRFECMLPLFPPDHKQLGL